MSSNIRITRICHFCEKEFIAKKTTTKTCSDSCAKKLYKARKKLTKVEVSNSETLEIKQKQIDNLKSKEFLSITETCKVVGISRRTFYRLLERGELQASKVGHRTIVKRSNIDLLFHQSIPQNFVQTEDIKDQNFDFDDSYTLREIQEKYGVSESTLLDIIKRNNVSKSKKGWYVYVSKSEIEKVDMQQ